MGFLEIQISNLAMVQDLYLCQISGVYQFYNKIP